jgi:hypothetical protein
MPREVRVHGVSGTPPRSILYTDPITRTPESEPTKIYQRPEVDPGFDSVAFHWANLTSGSRLTAFWILLAPYALANAAGWMAGWRQDTSAGQTSPSRGTRIEMGFVAVRAAGLAITSLFLVQAVTAMVVLPLAWLERDGRIDVGPLSLSLDWLGPKPAAALLMAVVGLLFYWLVASVSTRSHFDQVERTSAFALLFEPSGAAMKVVGDEETCFEKADSGAEDPAGASISDPRLWTVHPMLHRLRRLHLGFGFLTLGATFLVVGADIPIGVVMAALLLTAFILSWATTKRAEDDWVWAISAWAPTGGLIIYLIAVGWLLASPWEPDRFELVHSLTFGVAGVIGVFVALTLLSGPLSAGALVLATFFGAILGTTAGLLIDRALQTNELIDQGVGWVAVAMLALILWLAVVAVVLAFFGREADAEGATAPWEGRWGDRGLILVRRVVLEARVLFYAALLFGLASFGHVLVEVWTYGRQIAGEDADMFETLIAGMDPAALPQFPVSWITLGITIGLLGPGYFAVRSVVKGWRGGPKGEERRRQVGILWDIGSFWPRWFHPLAPPGYGPRAVTDLCKLLKSADPDMILGAHSQGSLISAVTISLSQHPTRFITYGSQLGILYPRMFPSARIPALVDEVAMLCPIWINLWRHTDYLGGQYIGRGVDDRRVGEASSGHSGYEQTNAYILARQDLADWSEPASGTVLPSLDQPS